MHTPRKTDSIDFDGIFESLSMFSKLFTFKSVAVIEKL